MRKIFNFYGLKKQQSFGARVFQGVCIVEAALLGGLFSLGLSSNIAMRDPEAGNAAERAAESRYDDKIDYLTGVQNKVFKLEKAAADLDTEVLIDPKDTATVERLKLALSRVAEERNNFGAGVEGFYDTLLRDAGVSEEFVQATDKELRERLAKTVLARPFSTGGPEYDATYLDECRAEGLSTTKEISACSVEAMTREEIKSLALGASSAIGFGLALPFLVGAFRRRKPGVEVLPEEKPAPKKIKTTLNITYTPPG